MLFSRVRAWLRQKQSHAKTEDTVVLLPKRAACFRGALELSLPADFCVDSQQRDQLVFVGNKTGLRMTVMQIPFRRPLQNLEAIDLQIAFRHIIPPREQPVLSHGFLRHSPTLTAVWTHGEKHAQFMRGSVAVTLHKKAEKTILHLIQLRRQTVFLMLFHAVTAENEPYIHAMLHAASADMTHAHSRTSGSKGDVQNGTQR